MASEKTGTTLVKPDQTLQGPAATAAKGARFPESGRLVDEGEVGVGGSGSVRRVYDSKLERRVAMKVLWPRLATKAKTVDRFVQEARITAQLQHPNIVPIHDLGIAAQGETFFTMKLVEGRTLASMIPDSPEQLGDPDRVYEQLHVLLKVCDAVAFAHSRGIIHCDIKPENIMVGSFGEVYLMDWGIASEVDAKEDEETPPGPRQRLRRLGIRGTPAFMAPEQAQGSAGDVGALSDIFGLGAVLYSIITGKAPFEAPTMTASIARAICCEFIDPLSIPGISPPLGLVRVVNKAMAARPSDRYPSVGAFRRDVDRFLRGGWYLPTRLYPAGETIVREGERADTAFIIAKGNCVVEKELDGQIRVVRRLGTGAVFGETAVLAGSLRTATVRAADDVAVKVVTRELLQEQLGGDSWLGSLVVALASRFRELDEELTLMGGPRKERSPDDSGSGG